MAKEKKMNIVDEIMSQWERINHPTSNLFAGHVSKEKIGNNFALAIWTYASNGKSSFFLVDLNKRTADYFSPKLCLTTGYCVESFIGLIESEDVLIVKYEAMHMRSGERHQFEAKFKLLERGLRETTED